MPPPGNGYTDPSAEKGAASRAMTPEQFHAMQMLCPETDMKGFDPDPPRPLQGRLACLEKAIELLLGVKGWPRRTGKSLPLRCKGKPIARKLVKENIPHPAEEDIDEVAARINWLQNNVFRWEMREGYAAYFKGLKGRTRKAAEECESAATPPPTNGSAGSCPSNCSSPPHGSATIDPSPAADRSTPVRDREKEPQETSATSDGSKESEVDLGHQQAFNAPADEDPKGSREGRSANLFSSAEEGVSAGASHTNTSGPISAPA